MNSNSNSTRSQVVAGRIEQLLRTALTSRERAKIAQAIGWDDSQVSRFLSGQQGVTVSRIDALIDAVGYVLVTTKYLDALTTLCEVGMDCECARQGGKRKVQGV